MIRISESSLQVRFLLHDGLQSPSPKNNYRNHRFTTIEIGIFNEFYDQLCHCHIQTIETHPIKYTGIELPYIYPHTPRHSHTIHASLNQQPLYGRIPPLHCLLDRQHCIQVTNLKRLTTVLENPETTTITTDFFPSLAVKQEYFDYPCILE